MSCAKASEVSLNRLLPSCSCSAEQEGGQEPAASTKAEDSQADIKAAQQALREAWQDASSAFGSGRSGMTAVQPRLLAFAQGRVQTFRDAMSEFMDGYSEGTKQVRTVL
jgi:hypothetical protein